VGVKAAANDASSQAESTYDRHYRAGGFRYEARRAHWEAWVRDHYIRAFDLRRGSRLLDIPCGDGFWSSIFHRHGFSVTGLDLSRGGIEIARARYQGICFDVANAEQDLPVPTEGFDVVFSRAISHLHRADVLTDSSTRMIRNLMRYVAPRGLLLVSYHTTRDGSVVGVKHNHPVSSLVALCEMAGDVVHVEVVDDYVQIGVERRDAGRARRRPLRAYLTPSVVLAGLRRRVERLSRR
jgi:2-polyprenyl-3-methyl-5-hydroxy-6-metoxy-1,4-benzoquinol methylase